MINSVVQFNENHKWCGCLGIVEDVADWGYLIGVPVPMQGTAYIKAKRTTLNISERQYLCLPARRKSNDRQHSNRHD